MTTKVAALAGAVLIFALTVTPNQGAFADPVPDQPVDTAQTQSVPFPDVPANSWVYDALSRLAADGYITGYPDGTFKGQRPMTRYEVAYLLDKVITAMKNEIAQGKTPAGADVAVVNRLAGEMATELKDLTARVDALQSKTDALAKRTDDLSHQTAVLADQASVLKKQANASTENLKAFQIKINYFARPGTFDENVVAVNGPTALLHGTIAPGAVLPGGTGPAPIGSGLFGATGQGTVIGQNTLDAGNYQHGVNFQETRIVFTGEPAPNFTYFIRLENKYQFSTPGYQSTSTPSFCTSTTAATIAGVNACNSQSYSAGNTPVRLNQSWLSYATPGGTYAKVGRWQEDEGTASSLGLSMGGNYTNGVQLGYKRNRISSYLAYGYGDTALTNQALNNVGCAVGDGLCATQSEELLLGMVSYDVTKHTNIGATYDDYIGSPFTLWNGGAGLCAVNPTAPAGTVSATTLNVHTACPANTSLIATAAGPVTGAYQTATTPLVTGSVNITQFIGANMKVTAEVLHRYGRDPFTNAPWIGANAFGAQFDYESGGLTRPGPLFPGLGRKNANVYEAAFVDAGFNGLSPDSGPGGTTPYQSFFFSSLNGFEYGWVTYQHWWSDNFRTGIVYHHFQTQPNTAQPAGSVTCPGCYLSKVNANALFFEAYLNM